MTSARKLLYLSAAERKALLHAALLIGGVRLCLAVLPFRTVLWLVNRFARPRAVRGAAGVDRQRMIWAVKRAGSRLLGHNPCLVQALVVLFLFRRAGFPARLRIGVTKDERARLRAHAWVESEGSIVIGGAASPLRYVPLPALDAEQV